MFVAASGLAEGRERVMDHRPRPLLDRLEQELISVFAPSFERKWSPLVVWLK